MMVACEGTAIRMQGSKFRKAALVVPTVAVILTVLFVLLTLFAVVTSAVRHIVLAPLSRLLN